MADPVTMGVASMGMTAIGAGIKAWGSYEAGQSEKSMYNYQAGVQRALAGIADKMAIWDIQAGEVKAQQAGLVSRAALGRQTVRTGAGNVSLTGSSAEAIRRSQIAIGQENQAIQRADAAHAAYGEKVKAAGYRAQSGIDIAAGAQAETAGDIGAVASIVGGAGQVAGKWYDMSQLQPTTTLYQDPNTPTHDWTIQGYG